MLDKSKMEKDKRFVEMKIFDRIFDEIVNILPDINTRVYGCTAKTPAHYSNNYMLASFIYGQRTSAVTLYRKYC